MAADQLRYIRGIVGINVNTVEIHEKDFKDKVNATSNFLKYCFNFVFGMEWELLFFIAVLSKIFPSFLIFFLNFRRNRSTCLIYVRFTRVRFSKTIISCTTLEGN